MDDIYVRAVAKWGQRAQADMAIEEMAECIVAVRHFDRGRIEPRALASEVADVEIMMNQLRTLVGSDLVDEEKAAKLSRLDDRIEGRANAAMPRA